MWMDDDDEVMKALTQAVAHLAASVIAIKTAVGFISLAETSPTADVSRIYREVNGKLLESGEHITRCLESLKQIMTK
jgi:hypothetical protein